MKQILHQETKTVGLLPVTSRSAGTANGTGVDRLGFFEAQIILINGDLGSSATVDVKIQHSDDDSTYADVTGAVFTQSVDATDDGLYKLGRINLEGCGRYIRAVQVTATAASDAGVIAILGEARGQAVTQTLDLDFNVETL